jgi:hypothetical protein
MDYGKLKRGKPKAESAVLPRNDEARVLKVEGNLDT